MANIPRSERVASRIFDVHNVERARMALAMTNDADTTNIATRCDHAEIAGVELDKVADLASRDVDDNRVVDLKMMGVVKQTFNKHALMLGSG